MERTTLERAEDLVAAGGKAERDKALDHALSLFQQAIECFIHFVNCEYSDSNEIFLECEYDLIIQSFLDEATT